MGGGLRINVQMLIDVVMLGKVQFWVTQREG